MHSMLTRCAWAGTDPLMVAYHDEEWGVPVYADNKLFEFLVLEGMQAGLDFLDEELTQGPARGRRPQDLREQRADVAADQDEEEKHAWSFFQSRHRDAQTNPFPLRCQDFWWVIPRRL